MKNFKDYCLQEYKMDVVEFLRLQAKEGNSLTYAAKLLLAPLSSVRNIAIDNNINFKKIKKPNPTWTNILRTKKIIK
jgi:hypothetical protein